MSASSLRRLASRASHASMPPEALAGVAAAWRSGALPYTRLRPHAPVDEAGLKPCEQCQEPCLPSLLGRVVWFGEPGAAERSRAR
eukprot:3572574-Pleurochrysis_carterae.AAC.1